MKKIYVNPAFPLSFTDVDEKKTFFSSESVLKPLNVNTTPEELINEYFSKNDQE